MQEFGTIVQVVPAAAKTWAVYGRRGTLEALEPVFYLALTDSGELYGLVNSAGCYEIAEVCDNFHGLCDGDLHRYLAENGIKDANRILEGLPCC